MLLLDEPASGLDPRARVNLRDVVRRQSDEGACVLVSSHVLSELEEMTDSAVFVEGGRVTGEYGTAAGGGTLTARRAWRLRALDPAMLATGLQAAGQTARETGDGGSLVDLESEEAAADLLARLVAGGVRVVEMRPDSGGLERAFLASGRGAAS